MPGKKALGHPPRGLMQWRYRLESTQDRESRQVAAKSNTAEPTHLVYISYIWALVIGKRTLTPLLFSMTLQTVHNGT